MIPRLTKYSLNTNGRVKLKIALISDLHDRPFEDVIETVRNEAPDMIALAGDITNNRIDSGYSVLRQAASLCAEIAPTYYSYGNHESAYNADDDAEIAGTGAVLLDNCYVRRGELVIGGLTSGYTAYHRNGGEEHIDRPEISWLDGYAAEDGYKILLCHHPEYYPDMLKHLDIDLILSGHAHGGQIRIFGRGLYAPGQGFFPRYTSGVYEKRLVVSRGLSNTGGFVPRLFNPVEVVTVNLY